MTIPDPAFGWLEGRPFVIQDLILQAGLNRRHELLFQAGRPENLGEFPNVESFWTAKRVIGWIKYVECIWTM